jgi:hypothetical protein
MLEPIKVTHREKYTGDKNPIEVYITKDKGIFLKIDHQTFEIKSSRLHGEKYDHFDPEELLAFNLCTAINRLMEKCAKEVYDNRPLTKRLTTPQQERGR